MKRYMFLMLCEVFLCFSCQRLSSSRSENISITTQEPPLPFEKNFIREMAIGDSVLIVYRQSGWTNTAHLRNMSYYTFYAIQKVWWTGDKSYVSKRTFAYTPENRFQQFEFDTMLYKLPDVLNLLSSLEYYCQDEFYRPSEEEKQKCEWHYDFKYRSVPAFEEFISEDLCSPKYNKWRFVRPTHDQLEAWRTNDYHESIWKTEMLVFWRDTCKISYSDRLPSLPGKVYDY